MNQILHLVKENIVSIAVGIAWILYMSIQHQWHLFEQGWVMTLTAGAGSFVAGSTPLGNGAVSYPILVLVLSVVSNNARTFAMMIQSVGMSAASYRIFRVYHTHLDGKTLLWMCLTGALGFNVGFYLIQLPGDYVKSIYFSLTFALGVMVQSYMNRFLYGGLNSPNGPNGINDPNDSTRNMSLELRPIDLIHFVPVSMLGGILMSMVGTGFDVVLYIYFRFFYNMDELITTNHTIVAQAFLSLFGFYNALVIDRAIPSLIWTYWICAVPMVIVFAPLGNMIINRWKQHRDRLNMYIYFLECFQYVAGFVITICKLTNTIVISCCIVGGTGILLGMHWVALGRRRCPEVLVHV